MIKRDKNPKQKHFIRLKMTALAKTSATTTTITITTSIKTITM